MDKVFQKFLRSGIDLSPVGVERREDNNPYFCTPKGASIFGWAGVDGIHFCLILINFIILYILEAIYRLVRYALIYVKGFIILVLLYQLFGQRCLYI